MVDRENLPRPAPEVTEAGIPATEDIPEEQLLSGDELEGQIPPLDHPQGVTEWGTTASEQLGPEPLDRRILREEPEIEIPDAGTDRQFLEPGADAGLGDDEADSVGEVDVGLEDTLSAEEAAMSVVAEPPGMNYDPDPGYVDDEELG